MSDWSTGGSVTVEEMLRVARSLPRVPEVTARMHPADFEARRDGSTLTMASPYSMNFVPVTLDDRVQRGLISITTDGVTELYDIETGDNIIAPDLAT